MPATTQSTGGKMMNAEQFVSAEPGTGRPDHWAEMPLKLSTVRPHQKLLDAEPWFSAGGDWTVFECAPPGNPSSAITVAVQETTAKKSSFIGFSEAILLARDRTSGGAFLDAFATAFHQSSPAARPPRPLKPYRFHTALLAENQARSPGGGFASQPGTWTATKWFFEMAGDEAEVFFNYDLTSGRAEFSEKDPDYRDPLVRTLAVVLRDGRRPPRTPADDPNLTAAGPKIVDLKLLPNTAHSNFWFAPASPYLIVASGGGDGASASAVNLRDPDKRLELVRVEKRLSTLFSLDPELKEFLVEEIVAPDPDSYSSSDPMRLWWVERAGGTKRQLSGPWAPDFRLAATAPVSPEGRFVVVTGYENLPQGKQRRAMIYVYDRDAGSASRVTPPDTWLEPVGWSASSGKQKLVLLSGNGFDKKKRNPYLADPTTGALSPASDTIVPPSADDTLSPDGKLRIALREQVSFSVENRASGQSRTFTFHEDDRRLAGEGSLKWVSPRYIEFINGQLTLIDALSMKMSYPVAPSEQPKQFEFSPDFHWAATSDEQGVWIGRIVGTE